MPRRSTSPKLSSQASSWEYPFGVEDSWTARAAPGPGRRRCSAHRPLAVDGAHLEPSPRARRGLGDVLHRGGGPHLDVVGLEGRLHQGTETRIDGRQYLGELLWVTVSPQARRPSAISRPM
jgi:hypothetical protein